MQQSQNVDGIGFSLDVQPNIWELSAMNNSNVFSMNGQPNILQGMGNQICYKVFIMIFIFFYLLCSFSSSSIHFVFQDYRSSNFSRMLTSLPTHTPILGPQDSTPKVLSTCLLKLTLRVISTTLHAQNKAQLLVLYYCRNMHCKNHKASV